MKDALADDILDDICGGRDIQAQLDQFLRQAVIDNTADQGACLEPLKNSRQMRLYLQNKFGG